MSTIEQLKEAAYFEEPYMFLSQYLAYIKMGRDARFPDKDTIAEINIQWRHIFAFLEIQVSDSFIQNLAAFWLNVTESIEGPIDEDSLPTIEQKIKQGMFQSEITERESEAEEIKARIAGLKESVQLLLSEEIQIQNFYESLPIVERDEMIRNMKKAIRKKEANTFLEILLSFHRHNECPKVPKTYELDKIGEEWISIINYYNGDVPRGNFLAILEAKWFYLIHTMGIPNTLDKARDMHYFVKRNPKKLEVKPEDRNKFLERKLNLKPFQQDGKY